MTATIPVVFSGRSNWPRDLPSVASLRPAAEEIARGIAQLSRPGARPAALVVNRNRTRLMSVRPQGTRYEVRVCWRLLAHAPVVVDAIATWLETGRFHDGLAEVVAQLDRLPPTPAPAANDAHQGQHVNLQAVLRDVAKWVPEHTARVDELRIVWSQRRKATSSLRLGSARPDERLIRIHPSLDARDVPEYVTQMVVYHEVCHCIAPPLSPSQAQEIGEPHRIHHREFRALEARYPQLDEANRWVRDHFQRLARF